MLYWAAIYYRISGKIGARKFRRHIMGYNLVAAAIALVIVMMFGVHNYYMPSHNASSSFCQVCRPHGSLTVQGVKFEGACSNGLPQYVAGFNALAKSHISTPYMTVNMPAITIGAWFYLPNVIYEDNPRFVANGHTDVSGDHRGVQLSVAMGGHIGHFDVGNGVSKGSAFWWVNISSNKWYYYAGTYNSTTGQIYAYINGKLAGTGSFNGLIWSNLPISLGYNPAYNGNFVNGSISDVQIYNTSLSAGEIETLYLKGIGGAPLNLRNLAA